jgi:uncharacterized protein (TIGR03437 family)
LTLLRYSSLILTVCTPVFAQGLNPKPVKALGAPRLTATQASPLAADSGAPNWVDGRELFSPTGIALDNPTNPTVVYVSDTSNNRILAWRYSSQLTPGAPADLVIGQPNNFSTVAAGPGTNASLGLRAPTGIVVDPAGNLYVADTANNRILRFPTPFNPPNGLVQPDLVIGQTSFASNGANAGGISATSLNLAASGFPSYVGMVFDTAGSLYVSDINNNRVLVYPASALNANNNGPAATLVLGQPDFFSSLPSTNRGSASSFASPNALAIDVKGRLYVGDGLARVLVFQPPFILGSSAVRLAGINTQLAGQPPPPPISNTTLAFVQGVTIAGNRLIVSDTADHRVLIYDAFETWPDPTIAISPTAPYIIGQGGFADHTANRGLGEPFFATLNLPYGAAASSKELFIADTGNNRIVVYPIADGVPSQSGSRVIGQLSEKYNAANLIEGREFNLLSGARSGSIAIDRSSTPPHLYVADTGNNRILCFKDAVHVNAGDIADLVIGQPDVFRAVVNYPSGDATKPTATSLNLPAGLAVDSAGNLFVADSGNGRVLRFPAPFAQPSGATQTANLVIGQASFTTQIKDPTATTMNAPIGVALTADGSLFVSDFAHNRVLYFPQPLASGKAATKVLGQSDFNSAGPNGNPPSAGGDPARFISPRFIATDSLDRVYVADSGSARVAIFSSPLSLPATHATPALSLAVGISQAISIAIAPPNVPNPGEIWIADAGRNQISHYQPFAFLSQNSSPDAAVPVNTPLSVAYDTFNNLVVADGLNRVLFYVPLVSVTNAANYLTRAAAPGGIISIFPSLSSNLLGTDTANFNSLPNPLPLPTALGDTQVLINQQPAQLFYVSPTQINLPLSLNLAGSGTVDLRVVSKSTGQIYGATDLAMTTVSPGLFTLSATGSGQLAALNEDNTVNSPANPLARGHIIQIFGTGQGLVSNPPDDGVAATAGSLTPLAPKVLIGSVSAADSDVIYSGLAPGLIGVWQVNVRVSTTDTAGLAVPITISLSSVPSNDPSNPGIVRTTIALQ